jgi:hypothetical protein
MHRRRLLSREALSRTRSTEGRREIFLYQTCRQGCRGKDRFDFGWLIFHLDQKREDGAILHGDGSRPNRDA